MALKKETTLPYEDMLKLSDRELLDYSLTGEIPAFVYTKPPKREGVYDAEDIRSEVATLKGKTDYTKPLSKGFGPNNKSTIGNVNARSNTVSDYVINNRVPQQTPATPQMPTYSNATLPQYSSQYQAQIDKLLDDIINADKFSYDAANDDLFKYYAKEYAKAGDKAARDSMGRAMAASGGYNNTYAQTVAQQVQNDYNSQLTDMIPQLEQNAYDRYISELSRQQNNLGLLQDAENIAYNKYLDELAQQNYLNEVAYEREQDAIEQQNYLDELALSQLQAETNTENKTLDTTSEAVTADQIDKMVAELGGAGRVYNDLNYTDPVLHDKMEMMSAVMKETNPLDMSELSRISGTSEVSKMNTFDVANILNKLSGDSMRRNALLQLYNAGLPEDVFDKVAKNFGLA